MSNSLACNEGNTVEPVLKDCPIGHKIMVSQDRWSLVTGSVAFKCRTFCQDYAVLQDRWSLMAVVSQDRFQCTLHNICIIQILVNYFPEPEVSPDNGRSGCPQSRQSHNGLLETLGAGGYSGTMMSQLYLKDGVCSKNPRIYCNYIVLFSMSNFLIGTASNNLLLSSSHDIWFVSSVHSLSPTVRPTGAWPSLYVSRSIA